MKIQATGNNDYYSPFNRLPDEIVLQILNKLIDLKTLCFCYAVCKRFCSIVVQVDTISFNTPPYVVDCDDGVPSSAAIDACYISESFQSVVKSVNKFTKLKSVCINIPFPTQRQDNRYLFKWKAKFGNNQVDSFLILSPNSIYRRNTNTNTNTNSNTNTNTNTSNGNVQDDHNVQLQYRKLMKKKLRIATECLWDATVRFCVILFGYVTAFPLMEKVSITDSAKTGTVSLNGAKISEMRNLLLSLSNEDTLNYGMENLSRASWCYLPLLELPVSRYVMRGVTFILIEMDDISDGHDNFLGIVEDMDDFEDDEEEAAYNEALMEILKKHRGKMLTIV